MPTIYVRASRADVKAAIRRFVLTLAGQAPDTLGLARDVQLRLGLTALDFIKDAFVAKALGGVDEAGESWVPLAESTIRRRRKGKDTEGVVEILRDTGQLLNSLSPGVGTEDQVLVINPGEVIVGTNVKKGAYHHQSDPRYQNNPRLPQRRLWPEPRKWPKAWKDMLGQSCKAGILLALILLFVRLYRASVT